ncbi:MAG: helix-turn-helix domain-containing protein [Candidatus Bathyarchaeia archaeon]
MPTKDEEDAQILTRLGLTFLQAKVYLVLAKMGKATSKQISSATQIDRANVYRVISKLQELGLVEKMLTLPTIFEAVPTYEGTSMLLEHRTKENQEIEAKTKELLTKCERNSEETVHEEDCQFILVPKEKAILRKLGEMFDRVRETYEMIFYWSHVDPNVKILIKMWKTLLKKGIKIQFIAYLQEGEALPTSVLNLSKNGLFEIRCIPTPPVSTLSIFDQREALITTSSKIHALESTSLWVGNPGIVEIFQDFFELMWRNSTITEPNKPRPQRQAVIDHPT